MEKTVEPFCFVDRCGGENRDSNRRCDGRYVERGNLRVYHRDRPYYSAGYTQLLCVCGVWWCARCSVSDSLWKDIYHQHLCNSQCPAGDRGINFINERVAQMSSSRGWTRRCFYRENNSRYAEVCRSCSGTDKYVSESVQTLNGPAKNKHAQTDCVAFVDSGEPQHFNWAVYRQAALIHLSCNRQGSAHQFSKLNPKMLYFCQL